MSAQITPEQWALLARFTSALESILAGHAREVTPDGYGPYTTAEFASKLGIHVDTVRTMIREHRIKTTNRVFGRRTVHLIPHSELKRLKGSQ